MSKLSQNSRYRLLLKLYKQYRSTMRVHKSCDGTICEMCVDVEQINHVMQEVEKFPLTWEFYSKQPFKFSQDFENLIIFCGR